MVYKLKADLQKKVSLYYRKYMSFFRTVYYYINKGSDQTEKRS